MRYKVARDPIYSEIFISPLERIVIDTKPVQRLRFLSQLTGAEMVYPGASHTRFAHSLGTMHVSGLYAAHLFPDDRGKIRILRLAGLLHDIAHGPFSHQFDDVVYPMAGVEEGHDSHRLKILRQIMPKYTLKSFERLNEESRREVLEDLESTIGSFESIESAFEKLFDKVAEIFEGEEEGTVEFNVVQGPLGADRIDFILRDSYNSGTRSFGTGAPDRIIRHSSVKMLDGKEVLCYNKKAMDDIYTALFGRFMMYKNVYFHKTSRAADLMIQEILRLSFKPLSLGERVKDLEAFLDLTDSTIIEEIKIRAREIEGKENLTDEDRDLLRAKEVLDRLLERNLWKVLVEMPFSIEGIDPNLVSRSLALETLEKMRKKMKEVLGEGVDPEDEKILKRALENFDEMFVVDTPYRLTLVHPDEFVQSRVLVFDGESVMNFEEYVKRYPAYRLMTSNLIQILRIYVKEDIRDVLKKYSIVPKERIRMVTRW